MRTSLHPCRKPSGGIRQNYTSRSLSATLFFSLPSIVHQLKEFGGIVRSPVYGESEFEAIEKKFVPAVAMRKGGPLYFVREYTCNFSAHGTLYSRKPPN